MSTEEFIRVMASVQYIKAGASIHRKMFRHIVLSEVFPQKC